MTAIGRWIDRLLGRRIEAAERVFDLRLAAINGAEPELARLPDQDLTDRALALRERAAADRDPDDLLEEGLALYREAARRALSLRPVDEQLLAAMGLYAGRVVELATGEGKTLAAVGAVFLEALSGRGVHVLTSNDYLARRDAAWMGPVYRMLGVSVGVIQEGLAPAERRAAYRAEVTYATAKEAGFDLLRDGRCLAEMDLVHRPFHCAIVDEADSIMVDEARVPLVLAGTLAEQVQGVHQAARVAARLEPERDFVTDEHEQAVFLTDPGVERAERWLGCGGLHEPSNATLLTLLNQALHAKRLLERDVDYIVRAGRAELVDSFTGRVREDRRWPHGLQAAVHAKEGLAIEPEGEVLGTITLQHFLALYPKLAGMTATAQPAADELEAFYNLGVLQVPSHRPCIRQDLPDRVFSSAATKEAAVVQAVAEAHAAGRPVLVGTISVAESERLAAALSERGVAGRVLNAKNDEQEAAVIVEAGRPGAVTVSTNMAGRGVDIRLGGADEAERDRVVALGGLLVIGTNRHDSRRVDDQLRGRAGRQGDPGGARFFVSLEDELIVRYGIDALVSPDGPAAGAGGPIDDPRVAAEIARAQGIIEAEHLKIRRLLYRYAHMLEKQRQQVQARRRALLAGRIEGLLAARSAERWSSLVSRFGPDLLERVERDLMLFHLDRCWCEHLAAVADLQEAAPLMGLGGRGFLVHQGSRLDDYHRRLDSVYREMLGGLEDRVVESFAAATITEAGVDLPAEGLKAPASTWTYMTDESPFGDWLERIFIAVIRTMSRKRKLRSIED